MNTRSVRRALRLSLASLVLGLVAPLAAQQPGEKLPAAVQPMPPSELFKLMPPNPDGWKLTSSFGASELTMVPSVQAYVIREYLSTLPPSTPSPGSPPPPPAKTRLTLVDTGFDATLLARFTNFKPEAAPTDKAVRKFLLAGNPAVLTTRVPGKQVLTVCLALRFLVITEIENQPDAAIKDWLERWNLSALAQAAAAAPRSPVSFHEVRLVRLDELNPSASSTHTQSYATEEEAAAFRRMTQDRFFSPPASR